MKKFQNELEYYLAQALGRFVLYLPLKWALLTGRMIGRLIYYIIPIRKNVTLENLKRAYPEKSNKEIHTIARDTYINLGMTLIEFMRFPGMTPEFLTKQIKFVNADLMKQGRLVGKGVLCMSGHFGNWEIMGAAIRAKGYPIIGLVKEQRNKSVGNMVVEYRKLVGVETLPLGMAVRGVIKSLKKNKLVAIVADQDAHREGVFVNFLGRPSSTAPGPAIFALKTGAPLLFGVCVRNKNGHHTVYLQEIKYDDLQGGVTEENIKILTQRHASVLEECIKKWPDHWFWMHKRWKTKPEDLVLQ
ncbi:MAG TPA: lysophospholipid acyltransferase family protein [bacterium]|nr:lysophospholipid acyltransferase family protein [bacterium]HPN44296.1 lysophospholipid acyltransferase family protein [bacterium]